MENIYELLKKHFQKDTSAEEEQKVNEFSKKNIREYQILKRLWESNSSVSVKDFDSEKAWAKVVSQANKKRTTTISLYSRIKRVAAVAIILIASALTIYVINNKISSSQLTIITSQVIDRNEIMLNDGTKIWLNKDSKFTYPEKFKGKTRRVRLIGEAYFEVAKNPDKPFIIETDHADVTVLGTSFNINTDTLQTAISVTTGKVKVQSVHNHKIVTLLPSYMAMVTNTTLEKSQIINPNFLSWKTGLFLFKDTPIKEVVQDLNTYYNKQILIKNQAIACNFSASFDKAKLSDIIEILKLSCKLNIQKNDNFYEIN